MINEEESTSPIVHTVPSKQTINPDKQLGKSCWSVHCAVYVMISFELLPSLSHPNLLMQLSQILVVYITVV